MLSTLAARRRGSIVHNSVLVGVISFGSAICGTPDVPTVFTKLGYCADWIEDIVEKVTYCILALY